MVHKPTRYREIVVSGNPLELGRQIGEATRDEIRGFAEIALERVNKTVRVSRGKAMSIAEACIAYAEEYSPDMMDELRGVSQGSGVPFGELMLIHVRNQFTSEPDAGCTSFSAAARACCEQRNLVGQNWDNDPLLDEFTVVLTRRPRGKAALMNVTQAGLIAYIGMNDAGMGACLNTLPAPSRDVGVPHYFTVRGIYDSTSLDEAVNAVRRADRAISANIMLATPQGPADLEVTLDGVYVLRDNGSGVVTHSNHCLHPELRGINDGFPELIQSYPRRARIEFLLSRASRPLGVEEFKKVLRDHENHPRAICRHANDAPDTGFWETVFSAIIDPQAGEMHVTRGTPCDHPYETYRMGN